jgi:Chitin synthase
MLGVVYGLQAFIFIIKREFMLIGWMVVYILSYPVYSFFLPVYSFWCMDEFSWGNTRVVVGEGKEKKVIVNDDEKFDESIIPLKKFSGEPSSNSSLSSSSDIYEQSTRRRPGRPVHVDRMTLATILVRHRNLATTPDLDLPLPTGLSTTAPTLVTTTATPTPLIPSRTSGCRWATTASTLASLMEASRACNQCRPTVHLSCLSSLRLAVEALCTAVTTVDPRPLWAVV